LESLVYICHFGSTILNPRTRVRLLYSGLYVVSAAIFMSRLSSIDAILRTPFWHQYFWASIPDSPFWITFKQPQTSPLASSNNESKDLKGRIQQTKLPCNWRNSFRTSTLKMYTFVHTILLNGFAFQFVWLNKCY